ncbi:MAG: D-glycerate dehydrogenase [Alphaproteobacteria bacterium]|nr:D-glycerate dehydrogenase [Alphaproteobacteria bacterium]
MKRKPVLLITRRMPPLVHERAQRDYDARLNEDDSLYDFAGLVKAAAGADAMLICPSDKITPELVDQLPDSLKIIACFTAGYDHVNVQAVRRRGLTLTNAPNRLTDSTADIALLLMLGAARRAGEGEALMRAKGGWSGWHTLYMAGHDVHGKRLGIVGMGRIGRAVAKRARAFDMTVHYHNRSQLSAEHEAGATFHSTVESLLKVSDFLSLNCPLTAETRDLLNAERIALLPDGAIVVNTARGDVVDDEALIAALKSGKLAAAGLDVYKGEPGNINPEYSKLPNTFLLPHLGSATLGTRTGMGMNALDNIDAFFSGLSPPNLVA